MIIEKYKKELEVIENVIQRNRIAYYNTDNETLPGMKKLKETYRSQQSEASIKLIEKFRNEISSVLDFLNNDENDYLVYTDYVFINWSLYFHESVDSSLEHFSYKEKFEIIMFFIKRNLDHHLLDLDDHSFKKYLWKTYYAHLSEADFEKLYVEEINKKEKDKNNLYFRKSLSNSKEKWQFKQKVMVAHRMIKKHYFENKDNFSEKDMSFILQAFKTLRFYPQRCDAFSVLLKKNIKIEKEEKKVVPKKNMKIMNQKESKRLYREIMAFYDIDAQKVLCPLTLSEIILLVQKMFQTNISQKEIIKFILNINKEGLEAYKNSREKLEAYYPKIIKYASEETVSLLNSYLQEMMVKPQSYEDYSFWKENMEIELKKGLLEIRDVYEYELNEGMNLYRVQKESGKKND